jgi:hypothetical protein
LVSDHALISARISTPKIDFLQGNFAGFKRNDSFFPSTEDLGQEAMKSLFPSKDFGHIVGLNNQNGMDPFHLNQNRMDPFHLNQNRMDPFPPSTKNDFGIIPGLNQNGMDSFFLNRNGMDSALNQNGMDSFPLNRNGMDSALLNQNGMDSFLLNQNGMDSSLLQDKELGEKMEIEELTEVLEI